MTRIDFMAHHFENTDESLRQLKMLGLDGWMIASSIPEGPGAALLLLQRDMSDSGFAGTRFEN